MLDERRTMNPVPVVTSLPPDVSPLVAAAERLGVPLQPWQQTFLQNLMAEEEHRSLDDLPKPTFDSSEPASGRSSSLLYGYSLPIVNPAGIFTVISS